MCLGQIFPKETVVVDVESTEKDELFEELVEKIHTVYPTLNREKTVEGLLSREREMSTGIMHSVAVPHALVPEMKGSIGAIGLSKNGIDWDSLDGSLVHAVFLIVGAENETESHIQVLKSLALVLQKKGFVEKLLECKDAPEAYSFFLATENSI